MDGEPNQPRLRATMAGLPWVAAPGQLSRTHGHGRAETRSIKVISLGQVTGPGMGAPAVDNPFDNAVTAW